MDNHHHYHTLLMMICQYETKGFEKMQNNNDIRTAAKDNGVCLWELADRLHISEPTITRRLRRELPDNEKQHIFSLIDEIAAEKKSAAQNVAAL